MQVSLNLSDFDSSNEMSIGTETNQPQTGGGVSDNNQKALLAAKEKNFGVVSFMVKNRMVTNLGSVDSDNRTLLHYLSKSPTNAEADNAVDTILSGGAVSSFINKQDKNGDTPMHLAVKAGNHVLASRLEKAGSKLDIRNNQGFKIDAETADSPVNNASPTLSEHVNKGTGNMAGGAASSVRHNVGYDVVKSTIDKFFTRKQDDLSSELQTIGRLTDLDETLTTNRSSNIFIDKLMRMCGGTADTSPVDSDILLNSSETEMVGGRRKLRVRKGKRRSGKRRSRRRMSRSRELSRMIQNQAGEIQRKVLDMIIKAKKLDKDKPADLEIARNIRSVLWNMVKTDFPELKTNLDQNVQMEKLATDERILKIDPKKGEKLREASRKRRDERRKKMAAEKKAKEGKSVDKKPAAKKPAAKKAKKAKK